MTWPDGFARTTARPSPRSGIRLASPNLLRPYTTLGVGGPADHLIEPETVEGVAAVVRTAREEQAPLRVLGKGSNLVVGSDGVDGYVLRTNRLEHLRVGTDGLVTVGAGLSTARLLSAARKRGLGGLECLVGYPATVGGAVRMNAGGRWGEFGDAVESVLVVDHDGELSERTASECGFAYRTSRLAGLVIVEARLRLTPCDPEAYRLRIAEIHRDKSAAQPLSELSAGCVFKNPPGESAGRLVDRAGLLGTRVGGAAVSTVHGNFLVNGGDAEGDDVLRLIDLVREEVARQAGIELELEVEVWRRGGA